MITVPLPQHVPSSTPSSSRRPSSGPWTRTQSVSEASSSLPPNEGSTRVSRSISTPFHFLGTLREKEGPLSPPSPGERSWELHYVGRLRVEGDGVPRTFVDDAVSSLEEAQGGALKGSISSGRRRSLSLQEEGEDPKNNTRKKTLSLPPRNIKGGVTLTHPLEDLLLQDTDTDTKGEDPSMARAFSTGHRVRGNHRRTQKEWSPLTMTPGERVQLTLDPSSNTLRVQDKETVLLERGVEGVVSLGVGSSSPTHLGLLLLPNIAYIFKAKDPVEALQLAQVFARRRRRSSSVTCEHCPLLWYKALVRDLSLSGSLSADLVILKHLSLLGEGERGEVIEKMEDSLPLPQKLAVLRAHAEEKQGTHTHDTEEKRSDFLLQKFPGGGGIVTVKGQGHDLDLLGRAKRGLDHLIHPQRKGEKRGERPMRPRSSTLGALSGETLRRQMKNHLGFMDVTDTPTTTPTATPTPWFGGGTARTPSSWRQAIFKKVVTPPGTTPTQRGTLVPFPPGSSSSSFHSRRNLFKPNPKTKEELRELWRRAIEQQILLVRMERQNRRLEAGQELADVKRLKLSYQELGTCDEEAGSTWDRILSEFSTKAADRDVVISAILRGVPKGRRGAIWEWLVSQARLSKRVEKVSPGEGGDRPYKEILKGLTPHQHAILVDIGRTYPLHPFFSRSLGEGQVSLFNVLKAYSLLDPEVGYCQGLSFLAGALLMHLEEEESFALLKFIMFDLGLREHYKPDMAALQVRLYGLTRLISEEDPELCGMLSEAEVPPSLYAAPWLLTLFASTFPLGFTVRVLDGLLLGGVDFLTKLSALLILGRREALLAAGGSGGLEAIMDTFRSLLPQVSSPALDDLLKRGLGTEWDRQLLVYSVEYSVMTEMEATPSNNSQLMRSLTPRTGVNRSAQTDPVSPPGAEKHPILGDLIMRQNTEIAKLTQEKSELRKDVGTLLSCILTMQGLAGLASLSLPVPPEVVSLGGKYVLPKCGTSYAALLENPPPLYQQPPTASSSSSSSSTTEEEENNNHSPHQHVPPSSGGGTL